MAAILQIQRQRPRLQALGQAASPTDSAWDGYLRGMRDRIDSAWSGAIGSYRALRGVRKALGLPFVATGEATIDPRGAITGADERRMLEYGAVVDTVRRAIDDALSRKRRVGVDSSGIAIEALPTDGVRVVAQGGEPRLVDAQTGQPIPITGTIDGAPGRLGVLLIPIALFAAGAIVTAGAFYVAVKAIESIQVIMQEKTTQTLSNNEVEKIKAGVPPAEVRAQTTALLTGQRDLQRERTETERMKGGEGGLERTVKTVLWIGLAAAVLYLGVRALPAIAPAPRRAAA